MALNEDKLNEFLGRFVTDLGATVAAGNVVIGHQLGLYRSLAAAPATAEGLAERTHTNRRYVTEWLRGQAAGGYVQYDTASDTYSMTEEQAFALTNPDGAVYAPGAFVLALGTLRSVPRITEAFRTSAVDRYLSGVSHAVATDVSVSPDAGTPRRHPHATAARISVVLGGPGKRKPSDPDVDRYVRLLPGGRDEHRRCRAGGLRRRAGSDHPALVCVRDWPAHRRHRADRAGDRADRARCPDPGSADLPARS